MGCSSSRSTCPDSSSLPPSHPTDRRPPQFLNPPPEGARTLNAEHNWREKRNELPRLWNSYTRPEARGGEFQDECYDIKMPIGQDSYTRPEALGSEVQNEGHDLNKPVGHQGVIQESIANHGSFRVPTLKKAPTTREQARQWKVNASGVAYELDATVQ
ncbi:MAG: hypothetical protein HETSPECPRED_005870 [Heterodermia speciosa]|uniref:Uncharacterized protein n=1 Tax=Heterodermia speciosa TaxID=116794 RepID=A0A8H3ILQ5_9LECA|nr:MAG: hypothetical protein HETSPECPRED_005870 [Heterodermia speciosa]